MKNFFSVAIIATILSMGFMSCAKEDPAKGISIEDTFKSKATVKGFVYLNNNHELAPAGTQIVFSIANSDLTGILNTQGNCTVTAVVDANGEYSVNLPVRNDGMSVNVTIDGSPVSKNVNSEVQLFAFEQTSCGVIKNLTYLKDLTYKRINSTATIEGDVYLKINQTGSNFKEFVDAGTELTFSILNSDIGINAPGFYTVTTMVNGNGHYSINLPAKNDGTAIQAKIDGKSFILDVTLATTIETQLFELTQVTVNIIKDGFYTQNLFYEQKGSALSITQPGWVNGTYKIKLTYVSGINIISDFPFYEHIKSPVPNGTVITVTVDKGQFIPARKNDLVYEARVGNEGLLTLTLPAPTYSINPSGFIIKNIKSQLILPVREETEPGVFVDKRYKNDFNKDNIVIYGGETIDGGTQQYVLGAPIN